MRTFAAFAFLCLTSVAHATPVVVDRETLMQQIASLSSQMASMQQQLNDLQRQVNMAPFSGPAPVVVGPPPVIVGPPPVIFPHSRRQAPMVAPMSNEEFANVVHTVHGESFESGKMRVLKDVVKANYFTVAQTQQMVGEFTFDRQKLDVIRLFAPRILDRGNTYKLYASFDFSSGKDEVKRIFEAAP